MAAAALKHKLEYHLVQLRGAAAAIAEELQEVADRTAFAEAFCARVLAAIWDAKVKTIQSSWNLPTAPADEETLDEETHQLATNIGTLATRLVL